MPPVTIYSIPTCGFCKATKEYFKKHHVEYTDHDVSVDEVSRKKMEEMSGQDGVPFIVIGEGEDAQYVLGFDEPRLAELLGISE